MARKKIRPEDLIDDDFVGANRLNTWRITREDLDRIVANLRKIKDKPRVLDVGCGYGVMSCLLALEGCYVIGLDKTIEGDDKKSQEKRKERQEYWDFLRSQGAENLELVERSIGEAYKDPQFNQVDAVYCSWMPARNWTLLFCDDMKVPMVVHVIGETKGGDINDNEYDQDGGRTVTGFRPLGDLGTEKLFKNYGSPYQISRYPDYEVLDAWMVHDYRTLRNKDNKKLSRIRVDVRKELNI